MDPAPEGTYDDCLTFGSVVCGDPDALCLQDDLMDPMYSACALPDCVDACDCPAAPPTGDAPVRCDDILSGGGTACFLDCGDDQTCPDGMICLFGTLCAWPVSTCMDPAPPGDYADCLDLGNGACNDPMAECIVDDPMMPTAGVCTFVDCESSCDCPAAPAGSEAQPTCAPILDGGDTAACFLDCSAGEACPAGMTCLDSFICVW